jgi:hypothetical protein
MENQTTNNEDTLKKGDLVEYRDAKGDWETSPVYDLATKDGVETVCVNWNDEKSGKMTTRYLAASEVFKVETQST